MRFAPKKYKLHFSTKKSDEVNRLYFIELHKERLDVQYSTIEEDLQKTKVFEDKVLQHHHDCALYL
jgi:hypothetical protein